QRQYSVRQPDTSYIIREHLSELDERTPVGVSMAAAEPKETSSRAEATVPDLLEQPTVKSMDRETDLFLSSGHRSSRYRGMNRWTRTPGKVRTGPRIFGFVADGFDQTCFFHDQNSYV